MKAETIKLFKDRFRGFLPIIIDVETSGFDADKNALLELSSFVVLMNDDGTVYHEELYSSHVKPFEEAVLDKDALKFNGIDPFHPFRFAVDEKEALEKLFAAVKEKLSETGCQRAVLVGHNAWFDLAFLNAATNRCKLKSPFHSFTSFDTATLSVMFYGHSVLSKALKLANIEFDDSKAHSAIYDAKVTAELFCKMVNQFKDLGGWPLGEER